jgi:hypothetical protein
MEISSSLLSTMLNVLDAETNNFAELARVAGLQPNCDFCGADLHNVNFGTGDFSEFEFRNADLTGADLSHASGLRPSMFIGAIIDEATRLPDYVRSDMPAERERDLRDAPSVKTTHDDGRGATQGGLDQALPARPDVGFFGRDETLLALDRAFDTHRIVLLHADTGSGKTATAAEFARWYALTGGVEGPVLFSSFERHLPLARVLDKIGEVFGPALEAAGIHWNAITDPARRRSITLQVLRQVPVLWIWDNVEPVTGFRADWSAAEQQELRAFLRAAREAKVKFLLTSRRDEAAWLGELPRRVQMPAMPMQERLQLADAIVERRGRRLADLPELTPLLRFTRGNPLTILVTLGEALRGGIDTPARLDAFVAALHGGEVAFEDEASEGHSKSLGASLSYGFGTAFTDDERKVLALLHLFQGFVDVDAMRAMGAPENEGCLAAVRGLTRERGIALLDRAAEIGLLQAHGGGYYGIHPALPWYFRALFAREFPEETGDANCARRAFVEAMGVLGNFYFDRYEQGSREILSAVMAEEDNLLAAWRLARAHDWRGSVISAMQGLRTLYSATGRGAAWRRLVNDVVPDFVAPGSDGPLAGHEDDWSLVTEYRVRLAMEERNWVEAERSSGPASVGSGSVSSQHWRPLRTGVMQRSVTPSERSRHHCTSLRKSSRNRAVRPAWRAIARRSTLPTPSATQ